MKKIIFNRYGSVDDLQMTDVQIPAIKDDELLIRVKVVAINPLDWKILDGQMKLMTGFKFPKGIGIDFSGIVEKAGAAISSFHVGDTVFGGVDPLKNAALAEYIVVKEAAIAKKPAAVSFETAAAAVTTGVTALHILEKCNAKRGDSLLINGASGGVGMAVLQIAKQQGIKVTAVASGDGLAFIEKWQPDATIDYKTQRVLEQKTDFNAIVELAGNLSFGSVKAILKPQSVFVSTLPTPTAMLKAFLNNLFSSKKYRIIMANTTPEYFRQLCELLTQKGLEIPIAKNFAMADFKQAYQFARKGGIVGKVLISI